MQLQSTDKVTERADRKRLDVPKARWGRRFAIVVALLIMLIVGGYVGWVNRSGKAMERQVALYRAAGEPIELSDFIVSGVSDHDNAVIPLREAAKINEKTEAWKAYDKANSGDIALPLTDAEVKAISAAVTENANSFDNIDDAMTRKSVDWKLAWRSPAISILLPDLNQQRQLANLVAHRAKLNYQRGDHAAAVADARRVMFIGRTVGKQPFLVSHLVAIGINALAADVLAEIAPGLKIGDGAGEVKAADLSKVIAELLDEQWARDGYTRAMNGERAIQLDTARCLLDGRLSLNNLTGAGPGAGGTGATAAAAVARVAGKPMFHGDTLIMMRHTTATRDAMKASPDWPTFKAAAPPVPPEIKDTIVRHMLAKMMLPSFERSGLTEFRHAAMGRMTAIALAVRQYAVDHDGKRPAKLDELVPKYLSALPADSFRADGKPLGYVADPSKPLVYSVGENGQDDGGSEQLTNPARKTTYVNPWDKLDAVLHLTLQPRPAPEPASDGVGDLPIEPATTQATTQP
jgi:hypothetical protein